MKAVAYQKSLPITDEQSLLDIELAKPEPAAHDLVVAVKAISVNPVDTKVRLRAEPEPGGYKVLGWDVAGVVDSVGDKVSLFKPGDVVWYAGAIDRAGANSEYHCVDERIVGRMPKSLDYRQAAALPLTAITAWELLFDRLQIPSASGATLLIIGAAGGVGSIMIQLAKQLTDVTVIATASRPETEDWVRSLGADIVINHRESLAEQLAEQQIANVDYVASLTHTDHHMPAIIEAIAPQGRLALIDDPAALDIMPLKHKSVSIHWELMFTRSLYQTEDMIEQHRLLNRVADMVDAGQIKTTVAHEFGTINAANLKRAHELLESARSHGKIVLEGF